MTKQDMAFRSALPVDLFSQTEKSKESLASMIDKMAVEMKSDE